MDLEISQDLAHQRRVWVFERVGWALLALLLLAALLGLFGHGLLGSVDAATPDGRLHVEYSRFMRARSPDALRVDVTPDTGSGGRFAVWIETGYLQDVTIERITPTPDVVETGSERMAYVFAWDGAAGSVPITFEIRVEEAGRLAGRIGSGAAAADIRQFVYP